MKVGKGLREVKTSGRSLCKTGDGSRLRMAEGWEVASESSSAHVTGSFSSLGGVELEVSRKKKENLPLFLEKMKKKGKKK